MAKYRQVHLQMWRDSDFQNYSPQEKLLFIYLITNDLTNESGIYEISEKTISNETGIPVGKVVAILGKPIANPLPTHSQRLGKGLKSVTYDFDNHLVFIHNYRKYQNTGGKPSLILKCIQDEYKKYKNSSLWELFFELYPEYKMVTDNPLPTHCQPIANPLSTVTVNDNDNDNYNVKDVVSVKKDVNVSEKNQNGFDVVENSANMIKLSFVRQFKGLPYPYRSNDAAREKLHQKFDDKLRMLLKRTRGDPEPFINHMEQVSKNGKDIGSIAYFLEGYQGGASVWEKLCDQLVFDEHTQIKAEFKRAIDENKALKMIANSLVEADHPDWMRKAIVEYKKLVQKYELQTDPTEKQIIKNQILTMQKRFGL